jgi:hypothetical protein
MSLQDALNHFKITWLRSATSQGEENALPTQGPINVARLFCENKRETFNVWETSLHLSHCSPDYVHVISVLHVLSKQHQHRPGSAYHWLVAFF